MTETGESKFEERYYSAQDGLRLYARDYRARGEAAGQRTPVICLPGLTRNSRDFHALALHLSADGPLSRRVITLDSRGRGNSQWDENKGNYNLGVETGDVIAACSAFGIKRAIFIGTSRGGLILHLTAAAYPDLLEAVVLNDIGPVIEVDGLMRIRDYLNGGRPAGNWDEAADRLRDNHGRYFTTLNDRDWRDFAEAVYRDIDGSPAGDFDPAIAAQLRSADFTQPLPDLWAQFEGFRSLPLMVILGENSDLLSQATVSEMARRHAGLKVVVAKGQGHAPILHLGDLPVTIQAFLAERT